MRIFELSVTKKVRERQLDKLRFIGEFVPENHPVRTVNAILDNIDISDIESTYKEGGTKGS